MPTVRDIVYTALRHLTVLEVGQQASAEDAQVCLDGLRSLLDALNLSPQEVVGTREFVYTPPAGRQSFTIGPPGADIHGRQPMRIELTSFSRINNVDRPLKVGDLAEYNSKPTKVVQGPPDFVALVRTEETATVYLYPASDGQHELHLIVQQDVVTSFDSLVLNSTLTLPGGYRNRIEWGLAEEMLSMFSVPPVIAQTVTRKAGIAARRVNRANVRVGTLQMPTAVAPRGGFNIYEG